MNRTRNWTSGVTRGLALCALLALAGCGSPGKKEQSLEPRTMPGQKIVKDGSHDSGMLLYDGHLVNELRDRRDVEETVGQLTPQGTYSVLINDQKKRIFNVDSMERLRKSIADVEALQGPLPDTVTFTVRSPGGPEGTVKGKDGLFAFFKAKYEPSQTSP